VIEINGKANINHRNDFDKSADFQAFIALPVLRLGMNLAD